MSALKSNTNKDISLELMRIISAYFVIFNHSEQNGFTLFATYEVGSLRFWLYMPISVFCRFSVPIFFMISGILLLDKEESIKTLFKKRISKMVIMLFFISAIDYVAGLATGTTFFYGKKILLYFFRKVISGSNKIHLWFMYRYIVFLIILPFLRNLVKVMKKKDYIYMFVLSLSLMIFTPVFQYAIFNDYKVEESFALLTSYNIVYPLLGYYLNKFVDYKKITKSKLALAWLANFVLIFISCFLTFFRFKTTGEIYGIKAEYFFTMFVIIHSSIMFVSIKLFYNKTENFINNHKLIKNAIITTGSCTFGIYLFHMYLKDISYLIKIEDILCKNLFDPMLGELIFCLLIFNIGFAITYLLKHSSMFKNLI